MSPKWKNLAWGQLSCWQHKQTVLYQAKFPQPMHRSGNQAVMCNPHACALIHALVRCSESCRTLEICLCNVISNCSQIFSFFILITLRSFARSLFEAGTASAYFSSCFSFLGCCVPFCVLPNPRRLCLRSAWEA